jgi:hypothetical protein
MASPLIIAATAASLAFSAPPVDVGTDVLPTAGGCGAAARQVVSQTGGRLLSAQPGKNGKVCVVTVLVPGKGNARPRKVTVRVPM